MELGQWVWKPDGDVTNCPNYSHLWPTHTRGIVSANCLVFILAALIVEIWCWVRHMFPDSWVLPTPRPIWLNVLMPLKDKEGKNPLYMSKTAWKYFDELWRIFRVLTSLHDVALFSYSAQLRTMMWDKSFVLEITRGPDIEMIVRVIIIISLSSLTPQT